MAKVAIIGSGSWGSALGIYLANQGNDVKLWSFNEDEKNLINNEKRCVFLPQARIPENVYCSSSYEEVLDGAEVVLHVTPSKFVRENIKKYKEFLKPDQMVIMCSKGFEAETCKTLDDVMREEMPNNRIGVLTGPSHAEEVSVGRDTGSS